MPASADEILAQALKLPETERRMVMNKLAESLPGHDEAAALYANDPDFLAELERRCADTSGSISWQKLRDES